MSLTNLTVKDFYTGDGSEDEFVIPFPIIIDQSDEVKIYLTGPDLVPDLQVETTDYVFFGAATPYDFDTHVRFLTPPASGYSICFARELPLTQVLDAVANGSFKMVEHERAYDSMVAMLQQLDEKLSRVVSFPLTKVDSFVVNLPEPNAGKALRWNDDENALINSEDNVDEIVSLAQAAAGGAQDAQAAAEAAQQSAEDAQTAADAAQTASEAAAASALAAQAAAEDALDDINALIDLVLGQTEHTFTNNQSATNLTGETYNSAIYESFEMTISIIRNARRYILKKYLIFNGTTWDLIDGPGYSNNAAAHGLTFTLTGTTTAQLQVAADNGGDNGTIKIKKNLFTV